MLTKKDLGAIDKKVIKTLGDFFEQVLAPYLEKLEKRLTKRFNDHGQRFTKIDLKLDKIDSNLNNQRIRLDNQEMKIASLTRTKTIVS